MLNAMVAAQMNTPRRILTMVLADVALVLAQAIFFSAAGTNDKLLGLPMFGLTIALVCLSAWATFTARGFFLLRVLNGLLLTAFVTAYLFGWVMLTRGPD